MARQRGPLQLTGSIGNLSFYYHKEYGYLARIKGGARPGKPAPRTKENGDELGAASRAGKLLRHGIRAALQLEGDSTVSQRLTGCLYRVLRHDSRNVRGFRLVSEGLQTDAGRALLEAFGFFKRHALHDVLLTAPSRTADGSPTWKEFLAQRDLSCPAGATHVELRAAVVLVDVKRDAYTVFPSAAQVVRTDSAARELVLSCGEPGPAGCPPEAFRVVALRVSFLQERDGELRKVEDVVGVVGIGWQ